jgi:excisionase family DNA binding protein
MQNPFTLIQEELLEIKSQLNSLEGVLSKFEVSRTPARAMLSRKDLVEIYKISYPTIHKLMNSGELPFLKVRRSTLFKLEDVERYFESNRGGLR